MSLIKRYPNNPILTKADVPYDVATVHNAGVIRHGNEYIMLFRSHYTTGRSILGLARSIDGYQFTVDPEPWLLPSDDGPFAEYEEFGVEDPRITLINDRYLITYSAYSRHGVRIGLAETTDFQSINRLSLITQADYRNVVIFPEKINGRYVRLDRPHSEISPWSMWITYSPDLVYWGESQCIMKPISYHWDEMKIGPGAPPMRTTKGWLNIYHGVFPTMDGSVYRLGACLHELDDPATIIARSDKWLLAPEEPYELVGYVHNVVFTCAAVPEDDGTFKLYWGGADTVMCAGEGKLEEVAQWVIDNNVKG